MVFINIYPAYCQLTFVIPPDSSFVPLKEMFSRAEHEAHEKINHLIKNKIKHSIYILLLFFGPFVDFVVKERSNQAAFTEGLVCQNPIRSEYRQIQRKR